MREIVKEFFVDTCLPLKMSDLKELGIDIASAPANGTIGDRQVSFMIFIGNCYHIILLEWIPCLHTYYIFFVIVLQHFRSVMHATK